MTSYTNIPSPIGELLLTTDGEAISGLYIQDGLAAVEPDAGWRRDDGAFADARAQLGEYFAGERAEFDLPLAPDGTEFQRRVWDELRAIPYGETRSYAEIAREVGRPQAVRAVGTANGSNPLAIVIPCHRVIASDGSLGGYGGGLALKAKLLAMEQSRPAQGLLL
jgi:methylated-DNA-[protein]-cysteine S-methyltransferase